MKFIQNFFDKNRPKFEKGGKFEKLHSTFDAFETFILVPKKVTVAGSHVRDNIDMKRTMSIVILALVPALLFGMWNVGYQHFLSIGQNVGFWETFFFGFLKVLPIIVVTYVVGLGIEFAFAQARGHEVNEGFLVTGMLIPLVMPADVPLWMVAIATAFAVIFGKEVFGGTGMNIVNPALLARAFLFFSYPSKISGEKIWVSGLSEGKSIVDGFSGATPLGQVATITKDTAFQLHDTLGNPLSNLDMFLGFIPGSIGETSKLAILLGALILLIAGIASWRVMLSTVLGAVFMAFILNCVGAGHPKMMISPLQHILMGGFMFGAVFMATDPVTAAQTKVGKWIYGFLIGVMVIVIRVFSPNPEGMMLAILLMNVLAPLIDYYVVGANISRRTKRWKLAKGK